MLHLETVDARTLSILRRLMVIPELNSFYLVGGTALALKYGHRISVDLDLFGGDDLFDREIIISALEKEFGSSFVFDGSNNK
ncbi:nucleotidyl transferase AbiEii/AbiGii toxin family protein [Dyadobacter sp. CY356]|uniref:nucleotidyl transferase AbiEii/AbiGii toxin family protein n=1 Tax=Dyadobacter sp. CY356 TaxID=2906442 RepID=UPI001F1DFFE5|nr:nucleotidyl transferase AbiEii/AbiGii toxin family protein [Dyadobacter sp. CY356]MCF0056937.1 nucleotidyl transferase AbiEii/AbiGii toxin family protein [Dyadobacter sp. CY356]